MPLADTIARLYPNLVTQRYSPYEQTRIGQEPLWQKALNVFAWPFEKVEEHVFKPALAGIFGGLLPELEREKGESWLSQQRREWEAWDDPSIGMPWKSPLTGEQAQLGIKGAAELAPWFAIPGIGWAGRGAMAGRGIAGAVAKTAPKLGRMAPAVRGVGTALEWSPWGMAEKAIGKAGKAVTTRVAPKIQESAHFFRAPSNEAIGKELTKPDLARTIAGWFGRKPVLQPLVKAIAGPAALLNEAVLSRTAKQLTTALKKAKTPEAFDKAAKEVEDYITLGLLTGARVETTLLSHKAAAMARLNVLHPEPMRLFGVEEATGIPAKVGRIRGGKKPNMADVLERPKEFKLNAEQTKYVEELHTLEDSILKVLKEEGIEVNEIAFTEFAHWVHRVVTGRKVAGKYIELGRGGFGRVGSKQSFEKTRFYETAAQGIEEGLVYSADPARVIDLYIRSAAKKISDQRIAKIIRPLGILPSERLAGMFGAELEAGLRTARQLAGARHLVKVIRRVQRGEALTGATLAAQERRFPEIGNLLREYSEKVIVATQQKIPKQTGFVHYSTTPGLSKILTKFHGTGIAGTEKKIAKEYADIFQKRLYGYQPLHKKGAKLADNIYVGEIAPSKVLMPGSTAAKSIAKQIEVEAKKAGMATADKAGRTELGIKIAKDKGYHAIDFGDDGFVLLVDTNVMGIQRSSLKEIVKLHRASGGSTYNLSQKMGSMTGKEEYALSVFPKRTMSVKGKDITEEQLLEFISKNQDMLRQKDYHIGTWFNAKTGKTEIDIAMTVKDYDIAMALAGKYNQKAIMKLSAVGKDIPVPRTGIFGLGALAQRVEKLERELKPSYWKAKKELARAREIAKAPSAGLEATIQHPAFQNRIFPRAAAQKVEEYFADRGFGPLTKAAQVSGALRTLVAAADFSAMFIQGLPTIARHPAAWGKGAVMSFRAFKNPRLYQEYLKKEAMMVNERAFYGGYIGGFETMEAVPALQRLGKGVAGKYGERAIRQSYGRFEASFGSFGDVTRNEMWKAMRRRAVNESEMFELARHLDRMTGVMSTKGLGIGRTQREFEQAFLFFAPRYTRAGFALIGDVFKGGMTGRETRIALAAMATAGAAFYVGISEALGQEPDLDPTTARFMTIEVTDPFTGKIRHMGVGGMMTSLIRFGMDVIATTGENPEDLFIPIKDGELNRYDNPFIRFLYSKSSPLTGFMTGMITGKNYFGEPFENIGDYANYMGQQVLPISLQQLIAEEEGGFTMAGLAGEQLGLRTFPQSRWELRDEIRDALAMRQYNMKWKELAGPQGPGKKAQIELEQASPELQNATEEAREYGSKMSKGDGKVWDEWRNDGKAVEQRYQNAIKMASAEFQATYDGTKFRKDVAEAGDIRRAMYDARNTDPAYGEIVEFFDEPIDPKDADKMNKLDLARIDYYNMMYSDDMYDQFGNYSHDKADQREAMFVQRYGVNALDYVKEYAGAKWDAPGPFKALREAQKLLKPYWEIDQQIWSQYPSEVRELYDEIMRMENKDPKAADRILKRFPQIVMIRKHIAQMKQWARLSNPDIARALEMFYR